MKSDTLASPAKSRKVVAPAHWAAGIRSACLMPMTPMVVAQAKSVEVEAAGVVFTFAPVHKSLRAEFERQRALIEELAQAVAGRKVNVITREGQPAATSAASEPDATAQRKADLTARAKAEPSVQAVLDVFGGNIEDVEEIE